jgi:3-methyladenine DNA glycosylase AlkC
VSRVKKKAKTNCQINMILDEKKDSKSCHIREELQKHD